MRGLLARGSHWPPYGQVTKVVRLEGFCSSLEETGGGLV